MEVYVGNTNIITLLGLRSNVDNTFIGEAMVEVTIVDAADEEEVPGVEWPIEMTPFEGESPSQGNYRGVISDEVEFEPNTKYVAQVSVNAGQGRIGYWEVPFVARQRR